MTAFVKILLGGLTISFAGTSIHQGAAYRQQSATVKQLELDLAARHKRLLQQQAESARTPVPPVVNLASSPTGAPEDTLATGDAAFDAQLRELLAKVKRLRAQIASNPRAQIPELRFLDDAVWFEVAGQRTDLDSADGMEGALRSLQNRATGEFKLVLSSALLGYLKTSNGRIPKELAELKPHCVTEIDDSLLDRYEMRASGSVQILPSNFPIIGRKLSAASDFDLTGGAINLVITKTANSFSMEPTPQFLGNVISDNLAESIAIGKAMQAFMLAHQFAEPRNAAELAPYFENKTDAEEFMRWAKNWPLQK